MAQQTKDCLAEIDRLDKILSGYDTASEFRRWAATRNEAIRVSPELFEVLALFDTWRERTGGALDAEITSPPCAFTPNEYVSVITMSTTFPLAEVARWRM